MAFAAAANRLWLLSQAPEYRRFRAALADPAAAQARKLAGYLRRAADTAFGREHGFARLRDASDYARAVPMRDWDGMFPWVERIARGEPGVLTATPVERLEPTSGTVAGAKFIPITHTLRAEISAAVAAWMPSLRGSAPGAFAGPAYWAVSPALLSPPVWPKAAIRVGHARDSEYLDPISAFLMRRILAVPEGLGDGARDGEAFFRATALRLLACGHLSFVSAWSPAFLLRIDETLRGRADWPRALSRSGLATRARVRFLERTLREGWTWRGLWPRLAAVSCWTQAQAALFIPRLRAALGDIYLEPKGLMATEGATTVPVQRGLDPVPALRSHFFEFLPDGGGPALGAADLRPGMRCETVLTTGGGLYRYRTGDLVEVTGMLLRSPTLRFLGRAGKGSDLVGEKLSEAHANAALAAFGAAGGAPRLAFLRASASPPGYTLFHLPSDSANAYALDRGARAAEAELSRNPYYAQARALGQLAPLAIAALPDEFPGRLSASGFGAGARSGVAKLPALLPVGAFAHLVPEPCPAT